MGYNLIDFFLSCMQKVLLDNLELELLKLENKVRFILGVISGEIVVSNRKRADLFLELQKKGFTPFPKKTKAVEPEVAGATEDTEETEENSEAVIGNGVRISDYEYLISMAIGTLTIERVQALLADRDKVNMDVDELRGSTPKSLWLKDLDALDVELNVRIVTNLFHCSLLTLFVTIVSDILCLYQELEKSEALADEAKRKSRNNQVKNAPVMKVSRQAPKNPRKNTKKANNAEATAESRETSSSSAMEMGKAKAFIST